MNDFAKTKKALESCRFCWQSSEDGEEERPPLARMIASGTRAYLALPETEPLVEGHALIVPIQHHLSMLEGDDDLWDEVRNFMKCLLQQAAQRKEAMGVVFYETVVSIKAQRHTCIEALPLPLDLLSALPSHFHQELTSVTPEWSQTSRVVSFTPGRNFRRSMTSRLPYFMIQFDYKGEKGYGHVLEGKEEGDVTEAGLTHEDADGYGMSTMSSQASGGKFERYFAAEVIGSLLDLEPVTWRKPRRLQGPQADALLKKMKEEFAPFDWTKALREQG